MIWITFSLENEVLRSRADGQVRSLEEQMEPKWVLRWKYWIAPKPVRPGVWRMKEGGYYIRGRATDPRTGRLREISKPLPDTDAAGAYATLQSELEKVRSGAQASMRTSFGDYAVSLMGRKIRSGEIQSAKTREQWGDILELHLVPAFGRVPIIELRRHMVESWKDEIAALIKKSEYKPTTANNWMKILRVIINSAVAEFEMERNPVLGVKDFDTSTHLTYTEEQPNSLTPGEVPVFLAKMREVYPQHFAFVAMGFATGLRPSTLRPIRRSGETPDVLWGEGVVLVRRSHTRKQEVMEKPKTGLRQRLTLPEELMEVLEWHAERLPEGVMKDSALLFPSDTGGFRSASCLDKPFEEVVTSLKLKKHITPRAMRRTFQDLARAAEVKDVVTRAVSGHATEAMQQHYSTVSPIEMKASLAKVIDLAGIRQALAA